MFYNSVGEPIPKEIKELKNRLLKQLNDSTYKFYDAKYSHQKKNTECGMYSLYFITTMLTKKLIDTKFNGKKMNTRNLIKYFKGAYGAITDKTMNDTRLEYFNSPQ